MCMHIKIKKWAYEVWRDNGDEMVMNAFIVRRRKENLFSSSTPAAAAPPSSGDKEREDFTLLYFLEGKCGQLEFQGGEGANKIMVGH